MKCGGLLEISWVLVLPNAAACAGHFEKPERKTSEGGVQRGVLVEKAPTENVGHLAVPRTSLACWPSKGFQGLGDQVSGSAGRGCVLIGSLELGHVLDLGGQRTLPY